MTRPLLFVVACFSFLAHVPAETYPVRVTLRGSSQPAEASAVCVGKSETQSLFLTNRHVARGAVQLFVADGQRWVEASGIQLSQTADVASFHVKHTSFRITPLMTGLPQGHRVDVCGYSNRSRFCFTGQYNGHNVDGGHTHVLPGDSGGAVLAKACGKTYCVGLANAYGTRNGLTYFVSAEQCRKHLTQYYQKPPRCQQYGNCPVPQQRPNYRRYKSVNPQFLGPPRIEFYEESTNPEIVEPPAVPTPQVSEDELKKIVVGWLEKNRNEIRGRDGNDAPSISIADVGAYLAANHRSELRGPVGAPGPTGPQGPRGEQGPTGPLTTYDDQKLIDLLADDPRVQQLIARLEALEKARTSLPVGLSAIQQRLKSLEQQERRVLLVEDGNVLDDESYTADQPIILDLKRIVRSNQ
jgi:hypothetical protein